MIRMKVTGLRELQKGLGELPKSLAKGAARRALTKAAEPIAAKARSNAPEDTRHLKSIVGVANSLTKRQAREAGGGSEFVGLDASGRRQFRRKGKSGVTVYVGPRTDMQNYAAPDPAGLMTEFGTVNQPPEPWLTPAFEGGKMQAVETLKTELGRDIEKTARRYAKRQARG